MADHRSLILAIKKEAVTPWVTFGIDNVGVLFASGILIDAARYKGVEPSEHILSSGYAVAVVDHLATSARLLGIHDYAFRFAVVAHNPLQDSRLRIPVERIPDAIQPVATPTYPFTIIDFCTPSTVILIRSRPIRPYWPAPT